MYPQGGDYQSDTDSNTPNESMAFTMYTTTFGNGSFSIQAPPSIDDVQAGFPTVPYLSLESILYQQQASNPNYAPTNSVGGATAGNTAQSSATTMADQTGITRLLFGPQTNQPGQ